VFVFDQVILSALQDRDDRRMTFIYDSLTEVDGKLKEAGSRLIVLHGDPINEIPALAARLKIETVHTNADVEPYAIQRDTSVAAKLKSQGIILETYKDHVIFIDDEVLNQSGLPFKVFTPYSRAWKSHLNEDAYKNYAVNLSSLAPASAFSEEPGMPILEDLGFKRNTLWLEPGEDAANVRLKRFIPTIGHYGVARDAFGSEGTSGLSVHLRHGTISIRACVRAALDSGNPGAEKWLNELIWRDFYHQVLHHHPQVVERSYRPEYDRIVWEHGAAADAAFAAWSEGRTGYPLVDAAMAQINLTGYMHNRLRMVVASFLVKDLGIDWRRGERYFAEKLNDFDLAANNGGWQWASSSGCDAQPYFRIFNPVSQSEKFDPDGRFIRRYLPQLAKLPDAALHAPWTARPIDLVAAGVELGRNYPAPIVAHDLARQKTLQRYAVVKAAR
jgi:deoxyribodipyrimidine photo-lyase